MDDIVIEKPGQMGWETRNISIFWIIAMRKSTDIIFKISPILKTLHLF